MNAKPFLELVPSTPKPRGVRRRTRKAWPVLALVPPQMPAYELPDSAKRLVQMLVQATNGELIGLGCVAMLKNQGYVVSVTGDCLDPVFSVACAALLARCERTDFEVSL